MIDAAYVLTYILNNEIYLDGLAASTIFGS
jgi:hypothetical protein